MAKKKTPDNTLFEVQPESKPKRAKKAQQPLTTAQQLGSLTKSARDTMRKDKGLNGDLDRLPMLTWIMFLKFLDDLEQMREQESSIRGETFKPAIEPPYRWRDWAARPDGINGDELIAFVNNDEAIRPDGTRGAGLFAYLRGLQGASGGDRRDVIATVFRGVTNRMINGYLLREVINKVNSIHFTSSEEIHTLGHLYESMLKEMRDAAGDSGEFYTPRAVVRFMVSVIDPKLGETLLDPACGTGGFLVEAYTHLEKQCRTVEDRRKLQQQSLFGGEAKPLPYLLAQMNLLLHGLESPRIDPLNSLRFPLREIGDKDRVDIILTNPPFGGEEERGIRGNFPDDKQTAETALLFMQLIMRKLRRQPKPGRAAVVVPNGMLFGDGVSARIKEELLRDFNLHTIVRLPNGVFAPYTSIPTNLLFFDRSGPTEEIWFYEQPLPEGRKSYSKTAPIQFDEFADCMAWWKNREENDRAWRIDFRQIYKKAIAEATPHWEAAQEATTRAKQLEKEEKEIADRVYVLHKELAHNLLVTGDRQRLFDEFESLKTKGLQIQTEAFQQREFAKAQQEKGDDIYWPIYNLDIKNPNSKQAFENLSPNQLIDGFLNTQRQNVHHAIEIKDLVSSVLQLTEWEEVTLGDVLNQVEDVHNVVSDVVYPNFGIYSFGRGLFKKAPIYGFSTSAQRLYRVRAGQFIYSRLFAFEGAYGWVSDEFDEHFVSGEYPTFDCDPKRLKAEYLYAYFRSPAVWKKVAMGSKGLGDRRQRVKAEQFLRHRAPLPSIEWQEEICSILGKIEALKNLQVETNARLNAILPSIFDKAFTEKL